MAVVVLNPHDVLKHPRTSRQPLISPPASRTRFPKNPNPSRSNRRKRSPNSSPPSRATVSPPHTRPAKSLTVGDVKILKRGESLEKITPPKEEAASKPVENERNGPDLDLGSTERLGPDPKSVTMQIRAAEPKKVNGFYAGFGILNSPPPSSLPLPGFFMAKKNDVVHREHPAAREASPNELTWIKKILWTPSKLIARLGKEINCESSYLYWAYKNNIPVFCPGLTDGSLGDMLYFHSFRNPGLIVDVVQDIRAMNGEAVHATPRKTGTVILGGGVPKHHICNANMMRNGSDYAVFINTAHEI